MKACRRLEVKFHPFQPPLHVPASLSPINHGTWTLVSSVVTVKVTEWKPEESWVDSRQGMGFISYPKSLKGPTWSSTSRVLGTLSSGGVKRQKREADKPHLVYRLRMSATIPTFPLMTSRRAEKLHI